MTLPSSPASDVPHRSGAGAPTETVTFPKEQLDRLLMGVRTVLDRKAMSALQQMRRDALMAAVVHHERDPHHTHDEVIDSAEVFLEWLAESGVE